MHRAEELLALGESVVLDASWASAAHRRAAVQLAACAHSRLVSLRCDVPVETAAERLRTRTGSISDADPVVAARLAAGADAWPEATVVPTGGPADLALAIALRAVG